jgi:hypothetical protein
VSSCNRCPSRILTSDRHQTRDAGFDQHLIKPVDTGALRELLDTIEPRASRRMSE